MNSVKPHATYMYQLAWRQIPETFLETPLLHCLPKIVSSPANNAACHSKVLELWVVVVERQDRNPVCSCLLSHVSGKVSVMRCASYVSFFLVLQFSCHSSPRPGRLCH